jgi:hypothetical protein
MDNKNRIRIIATGSYLNRHITTRLFNKYYRYFPDIKWRIEPHLEDRIGFPNILFFYNQIEGGNFETFHFRVTRIWEIGGEKQLFRSSRS